MRQPKRIQRGRSAREKSSASNRVSTMVSTNNPEIPIQRQPRRKKKTPKSECKILTLSLCNLAYSERYGHTVRKKYKHSVKAGRFPGGKYYKYTKGRTRCKMCCFTTKYTIRMFHHIQAEHLPEKKKKILIKRH